MPTTQGRRRQLDRLYEQEREERNERRGLEQRAGGTVAATVVALGLILTGSTAHGVHLTTAAAAGVVAGGLLTIVGMFGLTVALSGAHTTEEFSIRQAIARTRSDATAEWELEPAEPDDAYIDAMRRRVGRLAEHNARLVPILRLANVAFGFGVYMALAGLAVAVL